MGEGLGVFQLTFFFILYSWTKSIIIISISKRIYFIFDWYVQWKVTNIIYYNRNDNKILKIQLHKYNGKRKKLVVTGIKKWKSNKDIKEKQSGRQLGTNE